MFDTNLDKYRAEIEKDINSIFLEYEKQVISSKKTMKKVEESLKEKSSKYKDQSVDENQKALRKVLGKDLNSEIIDGVKKNMDKVKEVPIGDDR